MFSFIFHSYFNFGSHSTVNEIPKPLHCCRIQKNSKQFANCSIQFTLPNLQFTLLKNKCGFYSRVAFNYFLKGICAASIQGWLLFKGGFYSRKYGIKQDLLIFFITGNANNVLQTIYLIHLMQVFLANVLGQVLVLSVKNIQG